MRALHHPGGGDRRRQRPAPPRRARGRPSRSASQPAKPSTAAAYAACPLGSDVSAPARLTDRRERHHRGGRRRDQRDGAGRPRHHATARAPSTVAAATAGRAAAPARRRSRRAGRPAAWDARPTASGPRTPGSQSVVFVTTTAAATAARSATAISREPAPVGVQPGVDPLVRRVLHGRAAGSGQRATLSWGPWRPPRRTLDARGREQRMPPAAPDTARTSPRRRRPSSLGATVARTTAANVAVPLSALLTGPLLARYLGPADRGTLAAVVVPLTLVTLLGAVGLPEAVTYAVAVAAGAAAAGAARRPRDRVRDRRGLGRGDLAARAGAAAQLAGVRRADALDDRARRRLDGDGGGARRGAGPRAVRPEQRRAVAERAHARAAAARCSRWPGRSR